VTFFPGLKLTKSVSEDEQEFDRRIRPSKQKKRLRKIEESDSEVEQAEDQQEEND